MKSKCILIHGASDVFFGCTGVFADIVWCSGHDLQDLKLSYMRESISGHQTYDLGNAFIRLIPGCLSCNSANTLLYKFNETITLFPHNKHTFFIDGSFLG